MNMTIDEMCEYLRISRSTLWRLRKKGLPCFKLGPGHDGGRVLFNKEDVDEWIQSNCKN